MRPDDRITGFSISTWGVDFNAVCHILNGWTVSAGGSLTPDGKLPGEGSLGVTWFMKGSPAELRSLVLVTLYDKVQRADIKDANRDIPATFKGTATIWNDSERKVRLDYRNIALVPARSCPVERRPG